MPYALHTQPAREPERLPGCAFSPFPAQEKHKLHILLAEDVYTDAALTRIALDATGIPFELSEIRQGDEVLSALRSGRVHTPATLPDLLMLDLGLPGMNGFELLAELAEMPASVRAIPIVIITGHRHFEHIRNTYPLCIMAYINKPCGTMEMRQVLMRIQTRQDRTALVH